MQVNHVLGETADHLVRWFLKLLLYVILQKNLDIVRPIVWVCPFPAHGSNILPIIIYFLNFLHYFLRLFVAQIREKLFDVRQLRNRYLVVKLLVIWTVILVILRNCLLVAVHFLLLLLVLVELEVAAWPTNRVVWKYVLLFWSCREGATAFQFERWIILKSVVAAWIWVRVVIVVLLPL